MLPTPSQRGLQGRARNNKGEGWKVLSTEQYNRNKIRSETRRIDGVSSKPRDVANTNSLQRFDLLRQQPKQGQETQQGVSDRSDRSRNVANTQHDGSSTTEKSRSIEETNGRATQGENKACKPERSSTPRNTGTVQYNKRLANSMHEGLQGFRGECKPPEGSEERQIIWRSQPHLLNPNWRGYISKPTLRRGDDGLSNRVDRLKALGKSIVPAVATIPLGRILDLEKL